MSGGLQPAHGRAFRAPLAERSAVNRQVLGSIPSGGALFFFLCFNFNFFFFSGRACAGTRCTAEATTTPWRNGSAWDSKSQGWGFESLWRQINFFLKIFFFSAENETANCDPALPGRALDAMAQWQRVGFQILRLGVRVPLASFNQKL